MIERGEIPQRRRARDVKARMMEFVFRLQEERLSASLKESLGNGKMPEMTCCMEAQTSLIAGDEDNGLPACINEDLRYPEISFSARNMEARISLAVCLENKSLPACLYESLYNRQTSLMTRCM